MKLLPRASLRKTSDLDQGDWNYRPLINIIQRSRFKLLLRLLGKQRYGTILEIGYGSGVLMPELADHCSKLIGIDPHPFQKEVSQTLQSFGVNAELYCAGAEDIPLEAGSIDCAVAVSSLEFVENLDAACQEISRVMRQDGAFMVITPGQSPLLDFGLLVLTGQSAKKDFGDRRAMIIETLLHHFRIEKEIRVPRYLNSVVTLYRGLVLRKVGQGDLPSPAKNCTTSRSSA